MDPRFLAQFEDDPGWDTAEPPPDAYATAPDPGVDGADSGPVRPARPVWPVSIGGSGETGPAVLDDVRAWLERFINPMQPADLDLLTLWIAHTYRMGTNYTTPRLLVTSPLAGAGKTTVIEHCDRLAYRPVQMASVSSPAMLARLLDDGMRTLLIDEAEKNLRRDRPGVEDLYAIVNTGYKRGGTRPVLVSGKEGTWVTKEMPTFAPVVMAGIAPDLPDDTRSRCVTVMLLPDTDGLIEDSDWELIESDALALADSLAAWSDASGDAFAANTMPGLPEGCRGRAKERWRPLARLAETAGGDWPERCRKLIIRDLENAAHDREEGLGTMHANVRLLRDIAAAWPTGVDLWSADDIAAELFAVHPDDWGPSEKYRKGLTAQRVGRVMAGAWGLRTGRASGTDDRQRGYLRAEVMAAAGRAGVAPTPPAETGQTGRTGRTGPRMCAVCRTEPAPDGHATCATCRSTSGDSGDAVPRLGGAA